MQVWKKWLYHIQNLKINNSAKHDRKNNQDYNNDASETNDESTQHVIKTADERASRLLYRDSTRSAD